MKKQIARTPQMNNQQNERSGIEATQLIQKRAYELFMERGREPGRELEDWLQAEQGIRKQQQNQV
jgi:hypothetical protein